MLMDRQNMFSIDQDLSQVVASYLSDYSVDFGAAVDNVLGNSPIKDVGRGQVPEILVQVIEAFVGATATVLVELVMADDAALTSNLVSVQQAPGGSITVGIPVATLVAGYKFRIRIPGGITKRYLGLRYNIFTATTTAGTITAGLAWNLDSALPTY